MRKLCLFLCALLFLTSQLAFAKNATAVGENLEKNLFKIVSEKNWAAVDAIISPGFQGVHTDKTRNRAEVVAYIKSLDIKNYRFENFRVSQDPTGNIIVITYELTYNENIDHQLKSGVRTKNLSIWENVNGKWMWIAHAVFD